MTDLFFLYEFMCVKFVGLHVYFGRDASLFFPCHPDYSLRMEALYILISIIIHALVKIGLQPVLKCLSYI